MTPSVPPASRLGDGGSPPPSRTVVDPRWPRRWRATAGSLAAAAALLAAAGPVAAQGPEPYRDPPFTCTVHDYGTEPPSVPGPTDDPLCVRYDKTNITVSTLEVVDFLAAEPGRVAIVGARCSYWQQDHWVVRVAPDTPPLVEWEGSYWYDARTGAAGGILRDLHVAGQPADATAFIQALRPVVGDAAADQLAPYASAGGGGGMTFQLPDGFAAEQQCASTPPAPGPDAAPTPPPSGEPGPATGAEVSGDVSSRQRLPVTGGPGAAALAGALGAGGLALAAAARRVHLGAAAAPWARLRPPG